MPEVQLGFAWDETRGRFVRCPTDDFTCPDWFSEAACDAADTVIAGTATFRTYTFPHRTGSFSVDQALLVEFRWESLGLLGRPVRLPLVPRLRCRARERRTVFCEFMPG